MSRNIKFEEIVHARWRMISCANEDRAMARRQLNAILDRYAVEGLTREKVLEFTEGHFKEFLRQLRVGENPSIPPRA